MPKLFTATNGRLTLVGPLASGAADLAGYKHQTSAAVGAAWYISGLWTGNSLGSSFSTTANRLSFYPEAFYDDILIDKIGIKVSTTTSGNCRLGIYACNAGYEPGNLIADIGAVSLSASGVATLDCSVSLSAGLYFFAALNNAVASLSAVSTASMVPLLGGNDGFSSLRNSFYAAQAYGSLPDPAPTALTAAAQNSFIFYRRG